MSVATQGPDDQDKFLADRKSIHEQSLPTEEAARRDRIASQAPHTLPSGLEKAEKVPTVVPGMTISHYSPDSNSPQFTEPFSPLYPREAESPILARDGARDYSGPTPVQPIVEPGPGSSVSQHPPPSSSAPPSLPSLICGIRRRTFWLLLVAVLIIVVAAAVGGGVGGAIAVRDSNNSNDDAGSAAAESSSSQTPKPTSAQSSQSTSSTSPGPTSSPSTKPHFDFTLRLWEGLNYTGSSQLFYQPGGYKLAFIGRSYDWTYGTYDTDKMNVCSVAFCRGTDELGWRGSTTDGSGGDPDEPNSGPDNVVIECGEAFADPGCPAAVAITTFATVPTISGGPTKSTKGPSNTKSTESASTTSS